MRYKFPLRLKHLLLLSLITVIFTIAVFYLSHSPSIINPIVSFGNGLELAPDKTWLPQLSGTNTEVANLNLTAESAFFVEPNTGQVLFEKDPTKKMHIASLTKIMTVILTMEKSSLYEKMSVSSAAASIDPDKMYLQSGEKLTVRELLDGIFLISANDAAETLAQNVTDNRAGFIRLMNKKAQQLGMKNTLFINPTGLEEDDLNGPTGAVKNQYSTAYDVSLMARYAIKKWPVLTEISSQSHLYLDATGTHRAYDLTSGINLLTTYPGVLGFKTGFTPQAGLTLVTYAKRGNHEVIGVLLNASDRREDARALLDYCFKKLGN